MEFLTQYQKKVESAIQAHINDFGPKTPLRDAIEYALLNGGKRFRPSLVFMIADALKNSFDVTFAALAVEYFHTASLIADDLPCMDDDNFRRNAPATHKKFGQGVALLASYGLIAEGYAALAKNPATDPEVYRIALENATYNTGLLGATGGQFLDLAPPDLSLETVRDVLHKKTVSLFEIAFVLGWIFGGGPISKLSLVKKAASHFGMAFQIADDLGDQEQDRLNGRAINVANLLGEEQAKKMFHVEHLGFQKTLDSLGVTLPEMLLNISGVAH